MRRHALESHRVSSLFDAVGDDIGYRSNQAQDKQVGPSETAKELVCNNLGEKESRSTLPRQTQTNLDRRRFCGTGGIKGIGRYMSSFQLRSG